MIDDRRTDSHLSQVFPDLASRWREAREYLFDKTGKQIKVTAGMRPFSEQMSLWKKGRSKNLKDGKWIVTNKKLIVTNAMPGQSFHQYGLAVDSCFMGEDPFLEKLSKQESEHFWSLYGEAVKVQGLEWGGDWLLSKNDRPHCQISYTLSIHDVQMIYEESGLLGVWEKCAIHLNLTRG